MIVTVVGILTGVAVMKLFWNLMSEDRFPKKKSDIKGKSIDVAVIDEFHDKRG